MLNNYIFYFFYSFVFNSIPLGGIGSRFKLNNDNNLTNPKALISVNNKPIIFS